MSEELEQYHQKGGTYVIPVEIMNYWIGEHEDLKSVIDKAIDIVEKEISNYGSDKYLDSLLEILRSKEC